jgi:hypothetical protein
MHLHRGLLVSSIVVASGACYPMLAHPAHVEEGVSGAVNSGLAGGRSVRREFQRNRFVLVPTATVSLASGTRPEGEFGGAARLAAGLQLPGFGFTGDIYGEAPDDFLGDYDAGWGIAGEVASLFRLVLSYLEIGRRRENGFSWFSTQGVGVVQTIAPKGWRPVWLPTVAVLRDAEAWSPYFFVTAIVGGRGVDCAGRCRRGGTGYQTLAYLGLGVERPFRQRTPTRLPSRGPSSSRSSQYSWSGRTDLRALPPHLPR